MTEGYPPDWNAGEQHPVPKKQLSICCSCRDDKMRPTAISIGDGFSMLNKVVQCPTCKRNFIVRRKDADNMDVENPVPAYFYSEPA